MQSPAESRKLRFNAFTVDLRTGEIHKHGLRLRVQDQPFRVLAFLLERPGDVVTREELRNRLWPADTFVDFDTGLNSAIKRLRDVLQDSAERPRYIETLPRRGYRFIGELDRRAPSSFEVPVEVENEGSDEEVPTALAARRHGRRLRLVLSLGLAAVVFAAAIFLSLAPPGTSRSFAAPIKSLAVLPLENLSGDPGQEYLADGMTEALVGRLSGIHDLRVSSRTSVMRFKQTQLSLPEIAKMLQVDAVVEGSVIRAGGRIRVHAQLIRGATDEHFWSEEYDREVQDILALESDVARSIAEKVAVTGQERTRLVAARRVSPEAYESYLKGKLGPQHNQAEIEERLANFADSINKDPAFAPAYVGLAKSYIQVQDISVGAPPAEIRPKAVSALRRALELDPELAEAHAYLAEMYQKQWKWAEAEAEFQRALGLKPNDATAHRGYADWLACQGRTEEALARAKRGRELDPVEYADIVAWHSLLARHYDEAVREYRSALALHPDSASVAWGLGFALIVVDQPAQAIPLLQTAVSTMKRSPGSLSMLATAYARAGNRSEALRLIDELQRRRQNGYVPAGAFIDPQLALGDYDQAFFWCDQAFQEQSAILQWIKVSPLFDPVRGDPRFKDLVRRVGLDSAP